MRIDEFLLARIAEDEAVARGAKGDQSWDFTLDRGGIESIRFSGERYWPFWWNLCMAAQAIRGRGVVLDGVSLRDRVGVARAHLRRRERHLPDGVVAGGRIITFWMEDGEHAARWDPARVLAECAAKRAIVAEHTLVPETCGAYLGKTHDYGCDICHGDDGLTYGAGPCVNLRAIAAVYAGHPDYDPSWRL